MTEIERIVYSEFEELIDEVYCTWSYIDNNGKFLEGCHTRCIWDGNYYSICYNRESDSWCVLLLDDITDELDLENQKFLIVYESLQNAKIYFQGIKQQNEIREEDESEQIQRASTTRNNRINNMN